MRAVVIALSALAALLCSTPAAARWGERPIILPDKTTYTCGQYLAFAAPWSVSSPPQSSFIPGVDYADSIVALPSVRNTDACLDGSTINWRWPAQTSSKGVYGYMELTYGNYDGGKPVVPVTPIQASAITTFRQELLIGPTTGAPADYNILNEFYLTETAGVASTKRVEIGFFWNAADTTITYYNGGTPCSTYTDPTGRKWACRWLPDGSAGRYIMYYSGARASGGLLDFKAVIDSLVGQGLVDGNLYLNGAAVGVEPVRNGGSMQVHRWRITLN